MAPPTCIGRLPWKKVSDITNIRGSGSIVFLCQDHYFTDIRNPQRKEFIKHRKCVWLQENYVKNLTSGFLEKPAVTLNPISGGRWGKNKCLVQAFNLIENILTKMDILIYV
jgi:hypothetical protein